MSDKHEQLNNLFTNCTFFIMKFDIFSIKLKLKFVDVKVFCFNLF